MNKLSPQVRNLIHCLNQLQNADIIIEVHEKSPVNILTDEPVALPADDEPVFFYKDHFESLLKEIEKIKFGQIILKIRDFRFLEMKSYQKIRLQVKNAAE